MEQIRARVRLVTSAATVSKHVLRLHAPVSPQIPARLRGLVNAAYAAHGRAENMSLNDWRDLELELKRRLENENQKRQR
jgi:hypothetical protein